MFDGVVFCIRMDLNLAICGGFCRRIRQGQFSKEGWAYKSPLTTNPLIPPGLGGF